MGFSTALALALGALVLLPWLAHRLRRSPPKDVRFAPFRFVPEVSGPSRAPRGLDDRLLFAARALIVLLLALVAAGPRIRTSTLGVRRGEEDASVVLILDDSGSMRAREGGRSRLEAAKAALRHVVDDLDGGDRAALVLAGRPARVVRGFSRDLGAIRDAIDAVDASDRGTDLTGALLRAEALAGEDASGAVVVIATDGQGSGGASTIETRLPTHLASSPAEPSTNCAVVAARGGVGAVNARIACAGAGRRAVRWVDGDRVVADREVDFQAGAVDVALLGEGARAAGRVELAAGDAIAEDDAAFVMPGGARLKVGVVERSVGVDDEERTPPALLRALEAVAPDAEVARLTSVPADAAIAAFDVLAIDHAVAWTADERLAINGALDGGLSLWVALGPASAEGALGASFEPCVEGPVRWESGAFAIRFEPQASAPVRGRARFVGGAGASTTTVFEDGVPFLLRVPHRAGAIAVAAVPADPRFGDASLRAGYVDAVAAIVDEARRLRPHGEVRAGELVPVPADAEIVGPRGPIPIERAGERAFASVAFAGEVRVRAQGREHVRHVVRDEGEILGAPVEIRSSGAAVSSEPQLRDRSAWAAGAILAALVLELLLRYGLSSRRSAAR